MMTVTVRKFRKWGGSLGFILPAKLVRQHKLVDGDPVWLSVNKGVLYMSFSDPQKTTKESK
jgi:antitoxin component of MazEF toxin-antitoxin module